MQNILPNPAYFTFIRQMENKFGKLWYFAKETENCPKPVFFSPYFRQSGLFTIMPWWLCRRNKQLFCTWLFLLQKINNDSREQSIFAAQHAKHTRCSVDLKSVICPTKPHHMIIMSAWGTLPLMSPGPHHLTPDAYLQYRHLVVVMSHRHSAHLSTRCTARQRAAA